VRDWLVFSLRQSSFKDRAFFTLIGNEIKVGFSVPYRERFLNSRLQGAISAEREKADRTVKEFFQKVQALGGPFPENTALELLKLLMSQWNSIMER